MIIHCLVPMYINTIGCHRLYRTRHSRSGDDSFHLGVSLSVAAKVPSGNSLSRSRDDNTMATRPYCVRQEKWTRRRCETWPQRPGTILTKGRCVSLRLVDKTNSRVGPAALRALLSSAPYACTAARHVRYNTVCRRRISDRDDIAIRAVIHRVSTISK